MTRAYFYLIHSSKAMKRLLHPLIGSIFLGLSLFYLLTARATEDEFLQNIASQSITLQDEPTVDIYRYHGLKPAEGQEASDSIYQDFALDSSSVGKLWADPDAKSHGGNDFSWVKSYVNRYQSEPYLTVEFARYGHGANLSIAPKNLIPETLPETAQLTFEARSQAPVCLGIRFMDRDGEVWGYGAAPLDYKRLCVEPGQQWTKFTVPLKSNHPDWFKFQHSGNVDLGNQVMEASLMAGLEFELGLVGESYFTPGTASFDLREIKVEKSSEI